MFPGALTRKGARASVTLVLCTEFSRNIPVSLPEWLNPSQLMNILSELEEDGYNCHT